VLILGSLPGRLSLEMQQYYAQPRNTFWKLLGRLYGFEAQQPYADRLSALNGHGVAVWDVCAAAHRPGSLDADISDESVIANDFGSFLLHHPRIHTIFFNGQKAATLYGQRVLPGLPPPLQALNYVILPSSSPAHAAVPFSVKLRRWSAVPHASRKGPPRHPILEHP
jgi:hypoxanthine-DNA glycosylase